MWGRLAASNRQYLLAGESDHRNWQIGAAVVGALPVLAQNGIRHLGLEWQHKTLQPVVDAFMGAGHAERSSGADLSALQSVFEIFPSAAARANPSLREKFMKLNKALLYISRSHGIAVHALDQLPAFGEFISGEPVARQEKFMRQLIALSATGTQSYALPPEEHPLFDSYLQRFYTVNLCSDKGRAASMVASAGDDRALVLYGSAHFRGTGQGGIDDHLPAHSHAYVLVGEGESLRENFPHSKPRREPDFVLDTEAKQAWLMPAGHRHGLG